MRGAGGLRADYGHSGNGKTASTKRANQERPFRTLLELLSVCSFFASLDMTLSFELERSGRYRVSHRVATSPGQQPGLDDEVRATAGGVDSEHPQHRVRAGRGDDEEDTEED